MNKRLRGLVPAFAAAGSLALAQGQPPTQPPAAKQPGKTEQQASQEQRPTFRSEANYVRLDVYPLAGGSPVQDLRQDEFEVFEDSVPQQIATFEHVTVRAAGSQETRIEPETVRESRQMTADPRARLFVLFIDTYHVTGVSGYNVRRPLVNMLNRVIGQDDLVAVMTPEMSAAAVTFARRTGSIEALLDRYWDYGKRERQVGLDPDENMYAACYPSESGRESATAMSDMATEMILRRREKMTLSALEDLVIHLQGLREERKAVFAVSEGWALYRPNSDLARPVRDRAPGPPQIGVGVDGRLRSGDLGRSGMNTDLYRCDQDRIALAQEDSDLAFRRLLDLANRANTSFYPVDPRGLPAADGTIGLPGTEPSVVADQARLKSRIESLRTLAGATDGMAIVDSNDIDAGLRRVVDDLSSYYLLGYYSTNTTPDGRFRAVAVRVKRPGVSVRTRRGYLAPTREEAEARAAASAGGPAAATPVEAAVRALPRTRPNEFVHSTAGYYWRPGDAGEMQPVLWVAGELDATAGSRDQEWKQGADVSLTVTGPGKAQVGEGRHTLSAQARFFQLRLPESGTLAPGDYSVRVTSKPAGAVLGTSSTIRVRVPGAPPAGAPASGQPMFLRRGPFSGAGWKPAGDIRFRRQERVKMEIPVAGTFEKFSVRLLDRNGSALNVPVTPAERAEGAVRVIGGEVTLAPLAAGDYVIEAALEHGQQTQKIVGAFRIIP